MKFDTLHDLHHMFFKHQKKSLYWRIFVIRTIGNVLILGSLFFVISQFYPVLAAELSFRFSRKKADAASVVTPAPSATDLPLATLQPAVTPDPLPPLSVEPKNKDFSIIIPKIDANSPIVADVDPFSQKSYDAALKKGVAHAKGTVYPGQVGNIYLFAHNTLNVWDIPKYNAVFFLLHNLEPDDRIVTYYKGERFDYKVFEKEVYKPTDLTPLEAKFNESILSLQTCWPPGTTWQRLVIRARLI